MTGAVLLAVGAIVVAAFVGGWLAQRIGQPRVLGEMVAGIALGPSALGAIWPQATEALFPADVLPLLRPLADLGLVLFMFTIGLDLDLDHLRGQGHRAVIVSHTSIVVPMLLGAGVGWFAHAQLGGGAEALPFALFTGTAMAVTAFPVLARILQETGLVRTRVGSLTLACAAVDDITAWCVLAAVLAIAKDAGPSEVLITLGASLAFAVVVWFVVRPLLARMHHVPFGLAITLALLGAWTTEQIGIHAIFGAFLLGAAMPRNVGDRLALVDRIEPLVASVLLPVLFLQVGLSMEIGAVDSAAQWGLAALILFVAVLGKLGGAGIAAHFVGEAWRDCVTIGILMNTRGLTEVVILAVGLETGVIGPEMFTVMVFMALATTAMAAPVLRRLDVVQGATRSRGRARSGSAPASG